MSVYFYRESPGKLDLRTLSRKTLNRWTGRIVHVWGLLVFQFEGVSTNQGNVSNKQQFQLGQHLNGSQCVVLSS